MNERSRDDRRRDDRAERVARSLAWLARYDALVDDRALFRAALEAPPPLDLLILPQRRSVGDAAAGLERRGLRTARSPWAPWHLRVDAEAGAGALPEVILGFAQPQGVASALAPQLLAPRPGERVLDLCAAPGGKTVLLDALSGGAASILAGEVSRGRTGILVQTLARAGVGSAVVVQQDGRSFPQAGLFDAILLDAPCTGEGTFRTPSPRYDPTGEQGLRRAAVVQTRLLSRALDLLAPGGRLVYSTCAYSPEENEGVLDAVLARREDIDVEAPPADFPGLPGVRRWGGQSFLPAVERTRRIFPHHRGSWGFFIARLRKSGGATAPPPAPSAPAINPEIADFLVREFGVAPAELEEFVFARRGRDYWVRPRGSLSFDLGRLRVAAPGLRAAHPANWGFTPTNGALRWLGARVRRRVVDIDFDGALQLLASGSLPVAVRGDGVAVAVRALGVVVGRGLLREGRLSFEIPRGWR